MNNHYFDQQKRNIGIGLIITVLAFLHCGCASKNVNPTAPRAGTGYVDFTTDDEDLYWQVHEVNDAGGKKEIFEKFGPLQDRVLRLALAPGHHRLRVTFMNHAVLQPGTVEVEVQEGMITPIKVTLLEAGQTLTENREVRVGGTAYGRYGRGTKIRAGVATMYQVVLQPEAPLPYKLKSEMPYAGTAPGQ